MNALPTRKIRSRLAGRTIDGFYGRLLRRETLAFDIGAGGGDHTRAMFRAGARVIATERAADTAEALRFEKFASAVVQDDVTPDELVGRYGVPDLVRFGVEESESATIDCLSQPIAHLIVSVRARAPIAASRALERIASLGIYETRLMVGDDWTWRQVPIRKIMAALPARGLVHARRHQ